jgi:adenine-specific DNA-methyltransferase
MGQRRFLLVQLPELTYSLDKKGGRLESPASKMGYSSIAEMSKERLKVVSEELIQGEDKDLGFRTFKLSSSNIKPWDTDFEELDGALLGAIDNIKSERSEQDVLYELLLKYGLDLAIPVDERNIAGKTVFIIGAGALVVCLDSGVSLDVVRGIAELKTELKPEVMRVVFKDSGFENDVVKTNTVQILKQAGVDDVKSL